MTKARELKIANMRKQYDYIQTAVQAWKEAKDGTADFMYVGELFSEVKTRLEEEELEITVTERKDGVLVNRISSAKVQLSDEELEAAWNHEVPDIQKGGPIPEEAIKMLFGGQHNEIPSFEEFLSEFMR